MANKKISQLDSRSSLSLSDLMAVGDPSTGYLYKTTISDLKTLTGAGVISFNGRYGSVVPVEGDYALTQLSDVIITSASNGQVLTFNGSNWVNVSLPAEADTLDTVTDRGNTTTNGITVGSVTAAGLSNLVGHIKTFATTGNVYIGASPTSAIDGGYKLDVNGSVRVGVDGLIGTNGSANAPLIKFNTSNLVNLDPQGFGVITNSNLTVAGQISNNGYITSTNYHLVMGGSTAVDTPFMSYGIGRPDYPYALQPLAGMGGYFAGAGWYSGAGLTFYTSVGTDISGGANLAEAMRITPAGVLSVANLAGTGSRVVSADANGVLSASNILSGYLPLTGGTLTGELIVSPAATTAKITFNAPTGQLNTLMFKINNVQAGWMYVNDAYFQFNSATTNGYLFKNSVGDNILAMTDAGVLTIPGVLTLGSTISNGTYAYTLPSATGTLALTSQLSSYLPLSGGSNISSQGLSSTTNFIGQTCETDYWKIYAYATTTDKMEMVFEVGDNASEFDPTGERFRFYYNATSSGVSKDVLILDYNTAILTTDLTFANVGTATSKILASSTSGILSLTAGASSGYTGGGSIELVANNRSGTNTRGEVYISAGNASSNTANGFISMLTANTERVRITYGGNVGIGTSTPFSGATSLTGIGISDRGGIYKLAVNDVVYVSNNLYYDGSNWKRIVAGGGTFMQLESVDGGAFVISSAATGSAGSNATLAERLRITNGGDIKAMTNGGGFYSDGTNYLYVGVSGSSNGICIFDSFSPAFRPYNNGSTDLGSSGNRFRNIYYTGSFNPSDRRLKNNIEDSSLGLDFIMQLNPKQYKYNVSYTKAVPLEDGDVQDPNCKEGEKLLTFAGQRTHFGLIAQEVKEVLPDGLEFSGWSLADKDDPESDQALNYMEFIAPLIKAVKELKAEIETLKA